MEQPMPTRRDRLTLVFIFLLIGILAGAFLGWITGGHHTGYWVLGGAVFWSVVGSFLAGLMKPR
jgi:hypothetical protein